MSPIMLPSWLAFIIAFILSTLLVPSVRASVFAADDILEAHEKGLSLSTVAIRSPFRESGPPVCMAQLIMMRHKLNQNNGTRKRRSASVSRQATRNTAQRQKLPNNWLIRLGRPSFGRSR